MQLIEQRLGLLQIERIEAFGEPPVDRSEQVTRFGALALIAPKASEARDRTEFPKFCLLLARDRECSLKAIFRVGRPRAAISNDPLSLEPVQLRFVKAFLVAFTLSKAVSNSSSAWSTSPAPSQQVASTKSRTDSPELAVAAEAE